MGISHDKSFDRIEELLADHRGMRIDESLNEGMKKVLEIVVLGRVCRNSSNIKNRQPLSKIEVSTLNVQLLII